MICPQADFQERLIQYLHENVTDIPPQQIHDIYSNFKNSFNEGVRNIHSEKDLVLNRSLISNKQNILDDACLLGIDYPSWFSKSQKPKLKIMVMGIDPLRNESTFNKLNADVNNDVIIGTPYALHIPKARITGTKHYWNFINKLSEENLVYLTDIYKVFFYYSNKEKRSYDYYKDSYTRNQKDLLLEEIDLINPDLIITFGGESFSQLTKLKAPRLTSNINLNITKLENRIPVLPMVHLSNSVRYNTKLQFFLENKVTLEGNDYGKAYYDIIDNYLKNL